MKKLSLTCFMIATFIGISNLTAVTKEEIEDYKKGLTKATFVTGAVYVGSWLGENWAVDLTSKTIGKAVKSNTWFFEITVGSAIRGRTLIQAIPIAAKKGALVGALTASITAPIIAECWDSILNSCGRIYNSIRANNDPKAEYKDYFVVGATAAAGSFIFYNWIK